MTTAADDDGWLNLAMNDEAAVADILLRLGHAVQPPSSSNAPHGILRWSVRQRRSKHVPRHNHAGDVLEAAKSRKKGESSGARASPTTPLSWSGATSVSGGGAVDGSEESSKPTKLTDAARSKVAVRSERIFKRPRKKKTLAELKEEESLLLKERRNLKNELETLRLTLEKQRATHESLKKLKLDAQLQQKPMEATTSSSASFVCHQHEQLNAVGTSRNSRPPIVSCKAQEAGVREAGFSLPDLNIPFGDDPNSEAVCGMS